MIYKYTRTFSFEFADEDIKDFEGIETIEDLEHNLYEDFTIEDLYAWFPNNKVVSTLKGVSNAD